MVSGHSNIQPTYAHLDNTYHVVSVWQIQLHFTTALNYLLTRHNSESAGCVSTYLSF